MRAVIRADLHRVIIKPLPADAACNPASNIKDMTLCREREMAILRQRVEFDWRVSGTPEVAYTIPRVVPSLARDPASSVGPNRASWLTRLAQVLGGDRRAWWPPPSWGRAASRTCSLWATFYCRPAAPSGYSMISA